MASNNLILRCKTEKGPVTLTELKYDSTVEDLKSDLAKLTQFKPENMKFLNGYPPKPLMIENNSSKLCDLGVKSGDTLIVEILKVPKAVVENLMPEWRDNTYDEMVVNQCGIMMRYEVPSNNSCLFTSIYFIMSDGYLDLEKGDRLRNLIVDDVQSDPEKYTTAFLGKPNQEYCEWIRNPAHWGGAIELSVLSEHFKIEIVAIDTLSLIAHCFGENNDYKFRAFLIYDGIHYDPLGLRLENVVQTMFLASDPKPMEMAMEVAKEAKSSHQFTDMAHFTIFCKVCKARFVGDKEVTEHARVTGHCEFGEF